MAKRGMAKRLHGAELLRKRLRELGWTQAELAERIGATAGPVSRWLSGERDPSLEMACRIQQETGVPVEAWRSSGKWKAAPPRTGTDG